MNLDKITQAKQTLKDHKYRCLTNSKECEVWECRNPNNTAYCFNIAIMQFGIAVVGDIGDYTFNYHPKGMGFLAGKDVEYYMHEKLTQNCKETEYAKEHIEEIIYNEIKFKFKFDDDESLCDIFNEDLLVNIQNDLEKLNKSLKYLEAYIRKLSIEADKNAKYKDFLDNLILFLIEANNLSYEQEAYNLLSDDDLISFADDMDYDFRKPKESLMQTLYVINECAKQIMEIKNKQTSNIIVDGKSDIELLKSTYDIVEQYKNK